MSIQGPANLYTVGFGTHGQKVEIPVVSTRDPSASDHMYPIGKRWINYSANGAYVLTSLSVSQGVISANWEASTPGTSEVDTLTGDSGGAISPDGGTIVIAGGDNITTVGTSSPGTITIDLNAALIDMDSITATALTDFQITAAAGQDIIMKMGDAAGANKVSFIDSADVEVASINSDGDFSFTDLTVVDLTATGTTQILGNNAAASTVTLASGVGGNTVSINNAANTSANVVNISAGAAAANSTVNILSGNGSAGTQTLNALTGTRAGALNLGTGAAAHVVTVGSASAGAITVDTAANISLDSVTASNFTVTGAADLTLSSTAGAAIISSGEAAADAIQLTTSDAAGGITAAIGTGDFTITGADDGGVFQHLLENTSDTASSDAQYYVRVAGTSSGDASTLWGIVGGTHYIAGVDNSTTNDNWVLSDGNALGTTNILSVDGSSLNATFTGNVIAQRAEVGGGVVLRAFNTDAGASSNAFINSRSIGGTGGDSVFQWNMDGAPNTSWVAGLDNSTTNDDWVLALGSALGTNNCISVDGSTRIVTCTTGLTSGGTTSINASVNANTVINSGTSTGTVTIGNGLAGAITLDTAAGVSIDAATASNLTSSLASSAAAVTISASAADGGITMDAGATPGVTFTNGTQSHQMLVGTGSPNGSITASQGSLYVDVAGNSSTTVLYCNTDGSTAWSAVGA